MTRGLYSGRTPEQNRALRTLRTGSGRRQRRSQNIDTSQIIRRLFEEDERVQDGTPSPAPGPIPQFRFQPPLIESEHFTADHSSPEPQPIVIDEESDRTDDVESSEQVYIDIEPTQTVENDTIQNISESMDTIDSLDTFQAPGPDSLEEDESRVGRIHLPNQARSILQWQNVFALLVTCGTVRMTVSHYETLRSVMNWQAMDLGSQAAGMPGIRKLQRTIMPYVREHAYPISRVHKFPICLRKAGARVPSARPSRTSAVDGEVDENVQEPVAPVRIVLPSEWARLDVSTGPLCTSMFENDDADQRISFSSIEDVPIVHDRQRVLDVEGRIFVQKRAGDAAISCNIPHQAVTGDSVIVHFNAAVSTHKLMQSDGIVEGPHMNSNQFVAALGYVWNASSPGEGAAAPQTRSKFGSLAEMTAVPSFVKSSLFRSGDIVAELTSCGGKNSDSSMHLLVYRFWRDEKESRISLIRIPAISMGDGTFKKNTCIISRVVSVEGIPFADSAVPSPAPRSAPSSGFLMDGRRYLTYRVLLYCDDFQPHTSKHGSFGGCYMLPLGLAPEERAGYGAVRVLGLTPPGVSSNEILRAVIPDIVCCTTTGITDTDANGNEVTIFIDVVGYIGDYPAVTHTLDVLGHMARAPCHLCAFQRDDRSGPNAPYYGFTTNIHSRTSSFNRSRSRIERVRNGGANAEELRALGLKATTETNDLPLHELSAALEAARQYVPMTTSGHPVVPAIFDPYQSSMVAPDHLLCGMGQDVLNAVLLVCSPAVRRHAEILILDALRAYNMLRQNRIFSHSPPSLLTMGMSERFAVLLVAPAAFECAWKASGTTTSAGPQQKPAKSGHRSKAPSSLSFASSHHPVLGLLKKFQTLVSDTHFWPDIQVDGTEAVYEFNRNNGQYRLDALFKKACEYVNELYKACKLYKDARKCLDKPNVHRFVELYAHTLPAFGHTRHIQELLFETAHQPLKRGILRSNHRDPQLAAMMAVLANDWESRLSIEVESAGTPVTWSYETCRRLQRLLVGRDLASAVDAEAVISTFSTPVLSELSKIRRGVSSSRHGRTKRVIWKLVYDAKVPHSTMCGIDEGRMDSILRSFEQFLSSVHGTSNGTRACKLFPAASSTYAVSGPMQSTTSLSRRGILYSGSIVQALTRACTTFQDGETTLHVLTEISGMDRANKAEDTSSAPFVVSFWFILALVADDGYVTGLSQAQLRSTCESDPYAIVLSCVQASTDPELPNLMRVAVHEAPCLLPLGSSIREVMCMHACTGPDCSVNTRTEFVEHCAEPSGCTAFYVYGRRQGYPPRTG